MSKKIPILEVFGPTIQGEGIAAGRKVNFIRTAGCDYRCSWCDSAFTWDGSAKDQIRMLTASEVFDELEKLSPGNFDYLVISGGNPCLLEGIGELINICHDQDVRTSVETQGSKWQNWLYYVDDVTLSPKPPSSGMQTDFLALNQLITRLVDNKRSNDFGQTLSIKIVIFDEDDFKYAKYIKQHYPDIPFFLSVGNTDVNEEGSIVDRVLADYSKVIDMVLNDPDMNGVRVLPQIHTLVWGNKKGV